MARIPFDSMADSVSSIATSMGATVTDKKFATSIDRIADAVAAIADNGGSGGGGADAEIIKVFTGTITFAADQPATGTSGDLIENKTIGELTGGKKIIGTFQRVYNSETHIQNMNIGQAYCYCHKSRESKKYDYVLDQEEDGFADANVLNMESVFRYQTSIAETVTFDFYVVCV